MRLEKLYVILYLDALVVKVKQEGRIANRSIYLAVGVNLQGRKEVLGFWAAQNEGARFVSLRRVGLVRRGKSLVCLFRSLIIKRQ